MKATREEIDALGHQLAYAACYSVIECHSLSVCGDAAGELGWVDISGEQNCLAEDLLYLEMRGLLLRHPSNADGVKVLDEDGVSA